MSNFNFTLSMYNNNKTKTYTEVNTQCVNNDLKENLKFTYKSK